MSYRSLQDHEFIRGKVPMTKSEVRTLSILKLQIQPGEVVWDIGAGTGSIAVEMACNYPAAQVIAIERNPAGVELITRNREAFGCSNLQIVQGLAPDVFPELPAPDRVLIGGSGGKLAPMLELLWSYPSLKSIVVNAVTLNTAYGAIGWFHQQGVLAEAVQAQITLVEMVQDYQMLKAHNPIFIITGKKQEA